MVQKLLQTSQLIPSGWHLQFGSSNLAVFSYNSVILSPVAKSLLADSSWMSTRSLIAVGTFVVALWLWQWASLNSRNYSFLHLQTNLKHAGIWLWDSHFKFGIFDLPSGSWGCWIGSTLFTWLGGEVVLETHMSSGVTYERCRDLMIASTSVAAVSNSSNKKFTYPIILGIF